MFVASAVLAVIGTALLRALASALADIPSVWDTLVRLRLWNWYPHITYGTGLILFTVAFTLLSASTLRYLSDISKGVNQIASGDLDVHIPIRNADELGRLADDINQMAARLKKSIEEERKAERSKNDLITSVSHDLRTPLTSILGYLDLVDSDQYEDEVTLRHYVGIAHDKACALKGLIDDLFEFTRVNHGSFSLKLETVNLSRLLEQLAEEFVPVLQKAGMEHRLCLPARKVSVQADTALLVRVFENLMSNAIRYGSEGRFVDIELKRENERAVVGFANYGPPIPDSEIYRIFDRFVRIEGSRSRDTGGAGLGLAIAKSIVELHGGSIRAYNEDARTVFEVSLNTIDEVRSVC